MRRKLYKAKENWVIGLAAGLAIMTLGANSAYADDSSIWTDKGLLKRFKLKAKK